MTWIKENTWWLASARKNWSPRKRDNVLIRAWLSQPIVCDGYDQITLEGGLQSVVCSLETGRMPDDVFCGSPRNGTIEEMDIQIPICDKHLSVGEKRIPVACISSGWFSPEATSSVRWIRCRPRAEGYAMKVVNVAMAEFKATNTPVSSVTANYIDFYSIGDPDIIRRLLTDLPNISADRSCGMGSVLGWEVTVGDTNTEWPVFQGSDGRVMRSVPTGYLRCPKEFDTRNATLRAPYWHKRSNVLCDVPVQRIWRI